MGNCYYIKSQKFKMTDADLAEIDIGSKKHG